MPAAAKASSSKNELTPLEWKIYKHTLARSKRTASQDDLLDEFGDENKTSLLMDAFNRLSRFSLFTLQSSEEGYSYVAVTKEEAALMGSLSDDERIAYKHISDAGSDGIWTKALRNRSGLNQTVMNRCLKSLETAQRIKSVKSVKNPTRKIYMLYHLKPSVDLSGGPWYTDNELDTAFIRDISGVCLQFIQQQTWPGGPSQDDQKLYPAAYARHLPTVYKVLDHLKALDVTQVVLTADNIQALLETLVYNEIIEKLPMPGAVGGGVDAVTGRKPAGKAKIEDAEDSEPATIRGDDSDYDDRHRSRSKGKKQKKSSSSSSSKKSSKKHKKRKHRDETSDSEQSESDSDSGSESDSESESSSDDDRRKKSKKKSSSSSKSSKSSSSKSKSKSSNSKRSSSSSSSKKSKKKRRRSYSSSDDSDSDSSSDSEYESDDSSDEDDKRAVHSRKSNSKKAKSRVLTPESEDEDDRKEREQIFAKPGTKSDASMWVYRALKTPDVPLGHTETPCSTCPVFDFCQPQGPVNAEQCVYYGNWIHAAMHPESDMEDESDEEQEGGEDDGDDGNEGGAGKAT